MLGLRRKLFPWIQTLPRGEFPLHVALRFIKTSHSTRRDLFGCVKHAVNGLKSHFLSLAITQPLSTTASQRDLFRCVKHAVSDIARRLVNYDGTLARLLVLCFVHVISARFVIFH